MDPQTEPLLSTPLVRRAVRWGLVAWALIGIAGLAYICYRYLLYPIRIVFPPLILATVLVYLLNPVVTFFERRGVPRVVATLLLFIVFFSGVGFGVSRLVPVVADQVSGLSEQVPDLIDRAKDGIEEGARKLGFHVKAGDVFSSLQSGKKSAQSFFSRITDVAFGVLHVMLVFLLGIVISIYALVDLPKIREGVKAMIPIRRRAEVQEIGRKMSVAVGGFVRGQLLVALFVGLASMLGLFLVGLPYWALVGLIAGLFNLVPLIGPFIGAVPAIFIAFTTPESGAGLFHPRPGWPLAVAAAIVLTIVQQIDNHIISPNVVARTVKLHPLTVILSLLAAGTLLGLFGMLFVVPVVASVKILVMHFWDTRGTWPPGEPSKGTAEEERGPPDGFPSEEPPAFEPGERRWWWRFWRTGPRARPVSWRRRPETPAEEREPETVPPPR
jgi:predicted PurR-regulated permease PerM